MLEKLATRDLVVSPILSADQIGASSVDLRMGTVVLVARAGAQSHVDPSAYRKGMNKPEDHDSIRAKQQKHERFDIPFGQSFLLHPGSLALVPTLEWILLPYDIQGMVTARSSWAREGLNIATATIVNPGYRGIVTLELANFGEIPIMLYPGLRLAQIAFNDLRCVDEELDKKTAGSQFDMSFEPSAGNIAKDDSAFIPDWTKKR
jgi:dCTP deaminase